MTFTCGSANKRPYLGCRQWRAYEEKLLPEALEWLAKELDFEILKALRAKPTDPDLWLALAHHLDKAKQPMPAAEIVERLMDRGKKGVDELNFVAFTLAEAGVRADDARRFAWRAVVQDPLNGYVVDTLGWCQLMAGDVDAAVATLARADRLSPDEGEVLFHLASALDKKGDRIAALTAATRAAALVDEDDPVKPRVDALLLKLKKAAA